MSKGLAYIRQRAASSMRKRKKSSAPGAPPSRHFGGRFEGLGQILFYYDPRKDSGVVGPLKFNTTNFKSSSPTLPALLEAGGAMVTRSFAYTRDGKRVALDGTVRTKRGKRRSATISRYRTDRRAPMRRIIIRRRPFMAAALQTEIRNGNIINSWKGQVTNG